MQHQQQAPSLAPKNSMFHSGPVERKLSCGFRDFPTAIVGGQEGIEGFAVATASC